MSRKPHCLLKIGNPQDEYFTLARLLLKRIRVGGDQPEWSEGKYRDTLDAICRSCSAFCKSEPYRLLAGRGR